MRAIIFSHAMHIDLRKTAEGTTSYSEVLLLPEELSEAGSINSAVDSDITVRRLGPQFFVEIVYEAVVARECGRCLKSFTEKIIGRFEFILLPHGEEDMATDSVDCFFYSSEEDIIDFSQTLYDEIMIEVPIIAVCKQDCKGFSTKLTKEVTVEEPLEIDPRWAALKNLKENN